MENIALESVAWRGVSFIIPGFVEPTALFLVPTGAVKSNPRAPETTAALALPPSATSTSLLAPALLFSSFFVFVPGEFPSLLSCKLSHAFKRMFVIF